MPEGQYYSGGIQRHQREGGSLQEQSVEFPAKSFDEKVIELRATAAADFVRQRKFGKLVEELMNTHSLEELTPAVCEDFLYKNGEFSDYNPALVKVVAEVIVAERETRDLINTVKH